MITIVLPTCPFNVSSLVTLHLNSLDKIQQILLTKKEKEITKQEEIEKEIAEIEEHNKKIEIEAKEKEEKLKEEFSKKVIKQTIDDFKKENLKPLPKNTKLLLGKKVSKTNKTDDLTENEYLECIAPVINYIQSYYYEINQGHYFYYDFYNDVFVIKTKIDLLNEVLIKIGISGYQSIINGNIKVFYVVSKLDKPRLYAIGNEYFINECKGILHKNPKPYNTFSEEIKIKNKKMLDYIKEITCSNNEEFYTAYLKYLSQVFKGDKPQVIIYKKSEEGTGKSTESDFIINYVLGRDVCLLTGSIGPLLTEFNKCFMGKLYVVFEEMPVTSTQQWQAVGNKLKTLATEKITTYRDLYEKQFMAENISNFVINTNVNAIKNSEGRRIVIAPINNSRIGDYDFFGDVRKTCFNLEVGECFYSYVLQIDTSDFFAEDIKKGFPETDSKRIAIAELLSPTDKFLKFNYLLKNKAIDNVSPFDLYNEYNIYCVEIGRKVLGKNEFMKSLDRCNIKYIKTNGKNKYRVSLEFLKDLAEKRKWLCHYDIDCHEEDILETEPIDDEIDSPLDGKKPNKAYYESEIARLQNTINTLLKAKTKHEE
jgi:hypothetical protein